MGTSGGSVALTETREGGEAFAPDRYGEVVEVVVTANTAPQPRIWVQDGRLLVELPATAAGSHVAVSVGFQASTRRKHGC